MVKSIQFRGTGSGEIVQEEHELPPLNEGEVLVRVSHSGLCGSDVHQLKKPLVLGHEGVGIVEETGSGCSTLKVGDRVGWGPINSTCGCCDPCLAGRDAYCPNMRNYGVVDFDTQGSLCSFAVRKAQWLFRVPDGLSSEDAAPLMCGGGSVWTPLIEHCEPYHRVAVVGIGGLGHFAVQFAAKMGCDVVVLSSSEDKREEALHLGAREFYATRGVQDYGSLGITKPVDRILVTSSARVNLGIFYPIMARNAIIFPMSVDAGDLTAPHMQTILSGHQIIGSCVCSRFLQDKMLDFAARQDIHSVSEKYPMTLEGVKAAVERLSSGKMRYRGILSWEY